MRFYRERRRTMNDEQKAKAVAMLLRAYFNTRVPSVPDDAAQGSYVEDHRTSFEIVEDLRDMMCLSVDDIVPYMIEHGYRVGTVEDGTPRWCIYRRFS